MISRELKQNLIDKAKEATENAYVPYSGFRVGACALTSKGNMYTGTNIENASYSLTICAERVAMVKAVSKGDNEIIAIAIVSTKAKEVMPCGACLGFMLEFMKEDGILLFEGKNGGIKEYSFKEMMPRPFDKGNIYE